MPIPDKTTLIPGTGVTSTGLRGAFRDQMPVSQAWAYFDHAAVGPIPRRAAIAIQNWATQACQAGDVHWPEWSSASSQLRKHAAALLHCQTSEIGLIPNTTFGINVVAAGYRWRAGDSVVVPQNEFPSNMLPWKQLQERGVQVRIVPVGLDGRLCIDRIIDVIDTSTRMVTVSWVGYASGYRIDLAELCDRVHRAGAQLFVDAIQGLGVFPLDTQAIPIDYAAADGHKWMLGPEGAGLLYIRQSNLERLNPMMIGWCSVESSASFSSEATELKSSAARYEGGSSNHVGVIGLAQSLGMLLEYGCAYPENPIAAAILENAASLRDAIRSAGGVLAYDQPASANAPTASGIVSFEMPDRDPMQVRKQLLAAGVVLSVRHNKLRIATHAYNDHQDIDRLQRALGELKS